MGQYGYQRCPTCGCNIECGDTFVETCPACKDYIGDKLHASGGGTGMTTATVKGPGLKPIGDDLIQDVY